LTGLVGMPRRVHTYPEALNWGGLNLISTAGAFLFAAGVLVVLIDLARRFRPSLSGGAGNIWGSGTLEWLGNDTYVPRSIPRVESRDPLWARPTLQQEVDDGRWYLANAPTGTRETLVTTPVEAEPRAIISLPGPGYAHLIAAAGTAGFFLLLTVKSIAMAVACGLAALVAFVVWMWPSDKGPPAGKETVDIGGGLMLPSYLSGPQSHSWMAIVVLLCAAASLYLSYVFSYLYLWTTSPQWIDHAARPNVTWPLASALGLVAGYGCVLAAQRIARAGGSRNRAVVAWIAAACGITAALAIEVFGHWQSGLRPDHSGYGAMVYMASVLQAQMVIAFVIMAAFTAAKVAAGKLDGAGRATPQNVGLFGTYVIAQGIAGLLLLHGFPEVAS
jgi:cytochrome c oxidase subunit I+III